MNNQAAMGRGARGGGARGGKNPARPPRFSKNSSTQSQVINQINPLSLSFHYLSSRIIQV